MPEAARTSLFEEDNNMDVERGLTINRVFSTEGQDPFDSVKWERAMHQSRTTKAKTFLNRPM